MRHSGQAYMRSTAIKGGSFIRRIQVKDVSKEAFARGVAAPHRLLFDATGKGNFRIYHHRIAIFRVNGGTDVFDVRHSFLRRGLSEGHALASGLNPGDLTPKQRLARSRANIRRRAAQSRPRLRRGWA